MALETQRRWTDKDVLRKINSWWRKLTIYLHKEVKHLLSCSVGGLTTLCFGALVYTNLYNLIYVARLSWCVIRSGSCDWSARHRQKTLSYVQQQNELNEGTQLKPNTKPDLAQITTDSAPVLVSVFPKRLRQENVWVTHVAGKQAVVGAAQCIMPFASRAYYTYLCPIRT